MTILLLKQPPVLARSFTERQVEDLKPRYPEKGTTKRQLWKAIYGGPGYIPW